MKKLSIFAVLALLVLGISAVAQAADLKATGSWQIQAQFRNNFGMNDKAEEDQLLIHQRMRTAFHFIANENLKAVLDTQIGGTNEGWGQGMYQIGAGRNTATVGGPAGGAGQGNIMLRQGYLEFTLPGTKIMSKVGFQTLALPNSGMGGGSVILDDQMAAAVVSAPITDMIKATGGYIRAAQASSANNSGSALDAVFVATPITPKGFAITPFLAYAYGGAKSTALTAVATGTANPLYTGFGNTAEGVRGYWAGLSFVMDAFQPFKVYADLNYGKAAYKSSYPRDENGRSGWFFETAVDYTGLSMMTPQAFFAYSSGEDSSDPAKTTSNRMPVLGAPQAWSLGSFWFGDKDLAMRGLNKRDSANEFLGFWALGASLKDISLIDNVKHTFTLMYVKGTNDADWMVARNSAANYGAMLTDKDSLWEVDFNTKYQMYKELSVYLNLGYINQDMDKDTWKRIGALTDASFKPANAYKAVLGLTYAF